MDYEQMNLALIKRYDLTEDGYWRKFRVSKPETEENPDQFIAHFLDLSKTERTFEGLTDLIVKEQFINSCRKDLAIHLHERAPEPWHSIWNLMVNICSAQRAESR